MGKNSDLLFDLSLNFQNKRHEVMGRFEKKLCDLEDKRGSKFYETEVKKAQDERDNELEPLKAAYLKEAGMLIGDMRRAGSRRSISAPTAEELRLLETLKMRKKVSEEEIERLANSMQTPAAVEVLREIASENGYVGHIDAISDREMTQKTVENIVKSLTESVRDFATHDTSRAARKAYEIRARNYGVGNETIPKRPLFTDKEGFYDELAPYLTGTRKTAFFEATDGE